MTTTRDYLNHFIKNPHSLIVKILGVFSIQRAKKKPVFFFLMQSVFYPDTLVSRRWVDHDIKVSDINTTYYITNNRSWSIIYKHKEVDNIPGLTSRDV